MNTLKTALRISTILMLAATLGVATADAEDRPASPAGSSSTQIGDAWIDVSYGRPILRGRTNIFGSGETYGETVNGGATLWRAGANVSTRIHTDADLMIAGTKVPAGDYSFFIDLKEDGWTAVLSNQAFMTTFEGREKIAEGITWGSYGHNPEHDVVRAPMEMTEIDMSIDQFSMFFADVTEMGGKLAVVWENQMAMLPFTIAK